MILGRCQEGAASQAAKEKASKAKWRTSMSVRMVRMVLLVDRSGGEAACRQVERQGEIATSFPNTGRKGKGLPGGPHKKGTGAPNQCCETMLSGGSSITTLTVQWGP